MLEICHIAPNNPKHVMHIRAEYDIKMVDLLATIEAQWGKNVDMQDVSIRSERVHDDITNRLGYSDYIVVERHKK